MGFNSDFKGLNIGSFGSVYSVSVFCVTPWSRILPEKLTVKKFCAFTGTRKFITAFTSSHRVSLSWARVIQSMPHHPIAWRSILILSFYLLPGLSSGFFPLGLSTITQYASLLFPIHAACPTHLILNFIARIIFGKQYSSWSSSLCSLLHSPLTLSLLGPNIFRSTLFSKTLRLCSSVSARNQALLPTKQ